MKTLISFKHNAIIVQNQQKRLLAELTYFMLPSSHDWLLEQLFGSSGANLKKYHKVLIQNFFKRVPKRRNSVRILDPLAKRYLRKHPEYQKYVR